MQLILKGYFSDLKLQSNKVRRLTRDREKKVCAAEANISCYLVPHLGEVPKTLYPTFPVMQPIAYFC